VLCRADGDYTDGSSPTSSSQEPSPKTWPAATNTVNAMARTADGQLLDPHDGQADLAAMLLRAVGDPTTRTKEDSMRALRAVRFAATKGCTLNPDLMDLLCEPWVLDALLAASTDTRRKGAGDLVEVRRVCHTRHAALIGQPFLAAALAGGL
jgi:hypothetical protein